MNEGMRNLLEKETGDVVVAAKLKITSAKALMPETVWNRVKEFAPEQGWLCLTDKVVALYAPADVATAEGIILSGELVKGNESLHIRQAEDGWGLFHLVAGLGDDCLMFREEYVSTENDQQDRLKYEVYWNKQGDCYKPFAGRFVGFVRKGGQ